MKPIKLDEYLAIPFTDEMNRMRDAGEHKEGFDMLDDLQEKVLQNQNTDDTESQASDSSTNEEDKKNKEKK
jgi:hypothetical protein